jgi:hypothetical protein
MGQVDGSVERRDGDVHDAVVVYDNSRHEGT